MKSGRLALYAAAIATLAATTGSTLAATVTLTPSQDNSIYSESGTVSNGIGSLYSGQPSGSISGIGKFRRALVQFNVGGSVPVGSTVTNVTLTLFVVATKSGAATFELHKVNAAWGEGTSSGAGQGAPATSNDATWTARLYSSTTPINWATAGGDFSGTISSSVSVNTAGSAYTFPSSAQLVADVQSWLNTPANNFGWLIKADESLTGTSKEFASREDSTPVNRPALTITFTPPAGVKEWSLY